MALISATSKVEIVSQAFSLIGSPRPVLDLDETPTTSMASKLYDTLLQDTLTAFYWRFALKSGSLNQLTTAPFNEYWLYAYQIPADYLTMSRVYKNYTKGGYVDFQIFEDQIWCNDTLPLYIDYIYDPGPNYYPAYFVQLLTYRLAAEIALPISQNPQLAEFWEKKAEDYYALARNRDRNAMPNINVQFNHIYGSHYGK